MPLSTADLATLSHLLDEALDLEPPRRDAWLDALPEAHRHLLPSLAEMLGQHGSPSHAAFLSEGPRLSDPATAAPGELVGPYRLIRQIGQGGMGTVWLAERADGRLKRQVALKLPRLAWGAGLAERMARERDIGALLEHPHIARLYDAGVDSLGRPYLSLEYIDGQPLDAWRTAQDPGVATRLRLFLQIARAVAYAHGRLVVHRDLKPSNVLVTADGEAHLLDFGIAKLLNEAASGDGELTQEQGRVLTPRYASPEQLRGEAITVASDVYSLGVLLYELLTGRLPHGADRQSLAALEEAILHTEPALASSRCPTRKSARELEGELDAILAKAVRLDPALRYPTADALADDIERHLNGERVLAQPDTLAYRMRKTLRRNRAPFAAAAAIGLAVIGGAVVSLLQARRANEEAEQARAVKAFVVDVLKVRQSSSDTLLERSAQLIDTQFAGKARLQAELFGVVGGIFHDMSSSALAARYAARQMEALGRAGATDAERAAAMLLLARVEVQQDHLAAAESVARQGLALSRSEPALETPLRLVLVDVLSRQGRREAALAQLDAVDHGLRTQGLAASAAAAEALAGRALLRLGAADEDREAIEAQLWQAIRMAEAAEGRSSRLAAGIRLRHADQLMRWLRPGEARRQVHAGIDILVALGSDDDIGGAVAEANILGAANLTDQTPPARASSIVEPSRESLLRQGTRVPPVLLAQVDADLAGIYLRFGDVARADEFASRAAAVLPAIESASHRSRFTAVMSAVAANAGRHAQADALARESLRLRVLESGPDAWNLVHGQLLIARNLVMDHRLDEASALLAQLPTAVPASRRSHQDDVQKADWVRLTTIWLRLEQGRPDEALALLDREDMTRMRIVQPAMHPDMLRARALCAAGRAREGLPLFEAQIEWAAGGIHDAMPELAHLRSLAGACAWAAGQRRRARELAAQARAAFARQPGVSPYYKTALPPLEQSLRKG